MLYTRKGDSGATKTLHCDQKRISKSSAIAEALGAADELNSLLGFVKTQCLSDNERGRGLTLALVAGKLNEVQHNLFIIQAELAGAKPRTQRGAGRPLTIAKRKVAALEKIIDDCEKELPPIKSFFVPGGEPLAALLDYARTVARRAERRVVAACDAGLKIDRHSLSYLNRLSSLLYALARLVNHRSGVKEQPPHYR